jgi:hypothetical protein
MPEINSRNDLEKQFDISVPEQTFSTIQKVSVTGSISDLLDKINIPTDYTQHRNFT